MEVYRRSSWLLLLLGLSLLATALQGVQGEAESEGPTESECRPYIEKALKELEAGETEDAAPPHDGDSKEDLPTVEITTDDSDHSEGDGDDEADGDGKDSTESAETEKTDAAEAAKGDEDDDDDDDDNANTDDNDDDDEDDDHDESGEQNKSGEDASQEEGSKEEEQVGEAQEDSKEDDDKSGEEGQKESEEEQAQQDEPLAEEAHDSGEEALPDAKDDSKEDDADSKEDDDKVESKEDNAVESKEDDGDDDGDTKAESKEDDEASNEDDGKDDSKEDDEKTDSKEDDGVDSKEDDGVDSKEDGVDSKEDGVDSKEDGVDSKEDGVAASKEEDDKDSKEESAETGKDDESAESKEEADGGDSKEDDAVASKEDDKDSKEDDQEDSKEDEVKTSKEDDEEGSKEDEAGSHEEADKASKEDDSKEDDSKEHAKVDAGDEESKEDEKEDSKEEAASKEESQEGDSKEDASKEKDDDDDDEEDGSHESEEGAAVEELIQESEEDLSDLRPREHIAQLLKLDEESSETAKVADKVSDIILKDLKKLYENAIKPLETLYKYRDLSNRHFGDSEIFSKPLILFMGPWSGGKSSIINYLLDIEHNETSLRTGAEPSPAYFNILMHGEEPEVLDGTELAADYTFSGLQKFGQGLEERLRGYKLPSKLLEKVNIVEIPGILEVRKQVSRVFPFNDACQWFIDRADIIFLVYDPSKLDVGPETEAILDQLKGREHQSRIVLNKADQVKPEELMRVQGALIWNISPLMSSAQPPIMYTTSLWSKPYEPWAPVRLLQAQERAFLRDLRSAVDKRIDNKIASARRFAVRVRNHAKMVDCYLTTYYNHKSVFGNRKQISDEIINHPQDYHIYEGLSTLTNISRYDLPDPDVYRDFFRLNALYDFQQLSATCTYFRGCPINRLDIAIAYDLPELVGKHKRLVETALNEATAAPTPGS